MKFKSTRYWIQQCELNSQASTLFCLVNACRYLGLPGPRPGSRKWGQLLCLPSIQIQAKALKVSVTSIDPTKATNHVPAILPVRIWAHSHRTLVIGGDGDHLVLVNHQPGFFTRRSWQVVRRQGIRLDSRHKGWAVKALVN
jgi:hypothetical protein